MRKQQKKQAVTGPKVISEMELHDIARDTLAQFLRGEINDPNRMNAAVVVLNAPRFA